MSDESQPRRWIGQTTAVPRCWGWINFFGINGSGTEWMVLGGFDRPLGRDIIFVPGSEPRPTIDPSKMKTIETCDKVDW